MSDIRKYLQIVESMYHYAHLDIPFRGRTMPVEVKMYGDEVEDWQFDGLDAARHTELKLTPYDIEEIEQLIQDELISYS